MDFAENPDHVALREAVSAVTRPYGPMYFTEKAHAKQPLTELWQALGAQGLIAPNIPEEFGGGGAGMQELAIICEQVGEEGCPLLLLLVSSAISVEILARFGTTEQKRTWLPRMATGETKIVFAITEPDAGSNTHKISTTARRDGSDWLLAGQKYFISGVDEAEAILVVARTGETGSDGRGRLSLFLVPANAPGLMTHFLPVDLIAPEKQYTLFFDDVRVSDDQLVGTEGDGFAQVFHGLNPERISGAALAIGAGRYALGRAVDYARTREVWGRPIGAHQGVSHPLARTKIELELASLMTLKAAWQHDHDLPAGEASNMAKYGAAEAAIAAVDTAMQTHGGLGMSTEYGLLPIWGLARLLRTAPVSREMILNHIAQNTLGLPRSY
ncbi:MAG TPA: acyl-CoA dehydrogenase family protein [Jatrophihabitans sp.]